MDYRGVLVVGIVCGAGLLGATGACSGPDPGEVTFSERARGATGELTSGGPSGSSGEAGGTTATSGGPAGGTDAGTTPAADPVFGTSTFAASLDSLKRRGLLVCVGTASGPIPPIDATQLAIKGSVFVTRPALADYIADPAEKSALANELFDHVAAGRIRVEINQRYRLPDAAQAHRDLESRRTTGSSIFVI